MIRLQSCYRRFQVSKFKWLMWVKWCSGWCLSKHQGSSLSLRGLRSLSDAALESFCLRELTGKVLYLPFDHREVTTSVQNRLALLTKAKLDDLIAKSDNILTKEIVQYIDSGVIKSLENFVAIEDDAIEILIRNVRRFHGNIRLNGLKFISEKWQRFLVDWIRAVSISLVYLNCLMKLWRFVLFWW